MATHSFDLVVIGAGPGGYVAAIRAAQLGLKTALIDKEPVLGGTCVRVGCIPSKALLESSELFWQAHHHFHEHGIALDTRSLSMDLPALMARKDKVVKELTDGLKMLMTKNKIHVFQGFGSFQSPHEIAVDTPQGKEILQTKKTIIATGSAPIELPHARFDGSRIISSTEALSLPAVPKHLIVIGAGAVGLELGCVWARLGSEVTVVELLPRIAPFADQQMSELYLRALKNQGLKFLLEHKMTAAHTSDSGVSVTVEDSAGQKQTLEGDHLLVCVGRRAFSEGLHLQAAGLETDKRGKITVDKHFQTSVPSIYAIGDVIDGPMLAHKAEDEGVAAAEIIAGLPGHVNYDAIPNIVYTAPELAMVGIHEQDCQKAGIEYKVGRFAFRNNGRAKALHELEGMVKIIADAKTDRILGVHIVGARASELITEAVVAMEFRASAEDLARICHAHPTLSEIVKEAALAVDRRQIHG